ncbi:MAG TPA: hypothetical protein VMN78_01795 [Longimicrobiales bacterium]|nr:hypothetical protein [Longimicrobiales bacterium]
MELEKRTVAILGGPGLVGLAVARRTFEHHPARIVLSALTRAEAERGVDELSSDPAWDDSIQLIPSWGDIFLPAALRERTRTDVMADADARATLLDDLYGELTDDVLRRSALGSLLLEYRPEIIIDCVNTATALAYQNVYASAQDLRVRARRGSADLEAVEKHLATLYLPQLIRHVQIALEAMKRAGTRFYLKVGTAGTGGMGLNIPFTHSEERPSRVLLSKAGLAGAHTLLLYLMARTPDAPAVKEIKPTAAISWKRIAYGEVRRGGRPIPVHDATRTVALDEAFGPAAADSSVDTGETLSGVFIDAGENGLFSLAEFETLTALGLMEFITPEEIAESVIREIRGYATGHDVVAALDAATSGPTYRAGVLRGVALEAMERLEREHGVEAVAYEMLGPPRLSKLLFEAAVLGRLYRTVDEASELDPDRAAEDAEQLIRADRNLRTRMLSIGLPILMPDGRSLLRGAVVKVVPEAGQAADDPRLVDNGWIDLRSVNWKRWRERLKAMSVQRRAPGPAFGSRSNAPAQFSEAVRPGQLAAWVFRSEDHGERIKR